MGGVLIFSVKIGSLCLVSAIFYQLYHISTYFFALGK